MNNDLISREALKENGTVIGMVNGQKMKVVPLSVIDNAPSISDDMEEDAKQASIPYTYNAPKHDCKCGYPDITKGEWVEGENGNIKCNKCGCEIRYSYLVGNKPDYPKFCCDCGAKMKSNKKQ